MREESREYEESSLQKTADVKNHPPVHNGSPSLLCLFAACLLKLPDSAMAGGQAAS